MAYELIFTSTEESKLETSLKVFVNVKGYLTIKTEGGKREMQLVCLEKDSAIKLAKEIRKQISFLKD